MQTTFASKLKNKLYTKFEEIFGIDTRSLAVMRIGFATLIIIDLINRSRSLVEHYTDFGVFPRAALLTHYNRIWDISFHLINGSWQFQAFLFLVAGIFAFLLLIGYKTRVVTIISWIFLVSLQNRNFLVLQGGDVLFRACLFWAMFLPWGMRYSIDSLLNTESPERPQRISSMATFAYLLQVAILYWFSAALKTGVEWLSEGSAIYYALSIDQFTTPIGYFLLQYPDLLRILTFVVLYIEGFAPFLFFSPIFTSPLKILAFLLIFFMHIGIDLSMKLGLFEWIAIVAICGFMPSSFWDAVQRRFKKNYGEGLVIFYDKACGFCQKSVHIVQSFLVLPGTKILPDDVDPSITKEMQRKHSWIIMDANQNRYFKFDGMLALLKASPFFKALVPLLRLKPFSALGTKVYEYVAAHRSFGWFSKKPPAEKQYKYFSTSPTVSIILAFLIFYVSAWNIYGLPNAKGKIPKQLRWIAELTRIDQFWSMFAPYPMKDDGWYIIPGELRDGTQVDVYKDGGELTWVKPRYIAQTYKSQRWRKYMMNLWLKKFSDYRLYYGRYLCRDWNTTHEKDKQLMTFKIIYMKELTLPDYKQSDPEMITLWHHYCFK